MFGMLIVGTVLTLFFWQSILSFFLNTLIPWLMKTIGPIASDIFKKIVVFVDKSVKWTRLQMRKAWAWLQTRIMSIKMVYKFLSPEVCVRETTTSVKSEEGNILENVTTEKLAYEDIPADVRAELNKLNKEKIVVDAKAELEDRFKKQIKEQEAVSDKEVLEILA